LCLEDFFIVFFVVFRNDAFLCFFNFDIDDNKDNNANNNKNNIDDIIEAIHNAAKEDK